MGNSPIGRYPVGLLRIGDILCAEGILGCLGRSRCRCVRGRLWTARCRLWWGLLGLGILLPLGGFPLCAMNDAVPLHIHLMNSFTGCGGSTIRNPIRGILLAVTLRRVNAVFRLVLCLHIGILHPLPSQSAAVNRLYGPRYHIPGFDIRHCNLPALWQTAPHQVWW